MILKTVAGVACAGALTVAGVALLVAPSSAQEPTFRAEVSPTVVKPLGKVTITGIDECAPDDISDGLGEVEVTILKDDVVVATPPAYLYGSDTWTSYYRVPSDAELGTYVVRAVCELPNQPEPIPYQDVTFTVVELPRNLDMTVAPAMAKALEEVTVTSVEPCPGGFSQQGQTVSWGLAYYGPDGNSRLELAEFPDGGVFRPRQSPDGHWSLTFSAPEAEGVYEVLAICWSNHLDMAEWVVEAFYEPTPLVVDNDGVAPPTPPSEPQTPVEALASTATGAAPATAVPGRPQLTG